MIAVYALLVIGTFVALFVTVIILAGIYVEHIRRSENDNN